jgi:hypothetical protein
MSFNRLSTEEIDDLKFMVRRELDRAESRLMKFLPDTNEDDEFADVRQETIDTLSRRKASMQSILGKLDRFHQSEARRFYQPDHYNNNYHNGGSYNNNYNSNGNYNNSNSSYSNNTNYQSSDSDNSKSDNRYQSESYND